MIIDDRHYDVAIVGSGAAGATLAADLAAAGHAVLLLERGGPLSLADQNVADVTLFRKQRYHPELAKGFLLPSIRGRALCCPNDKTSRVHPDP
jgi:choline dehydrogenase-like flavoprotein